MEMQLRKNVNDLRSAVEADRKKRDRVETDLRVEIMHQSADLMETNCARARMIEQNELTMSKLVDAARVDKRTAAEYIGELTERINALAEEKDKSTAELSIRDEAQRSLRARIAELQGLLTVNTTNDSTDGTACSGTRVPSRDAENPMYAVWLLGRGDNCLRSCPQSMVDNTQQPGRLSRSANDNVTVADDDDADVQPRSLCIANAEGDDQNISSEHSQTNPVKDRRVTEN